MATQTIGDTATGLPTYGEWMKEAFLKFPDKNGTKLTDEATREFKFYITVAQAAYATLLDCHKETYLLHGDLHHENILRDLAGDWCAIDPKGVMGPRIIECGRYFQTDGVIMRELTYDEVDEVSGAFLANVGMGIGGAAIGGAAEGLAEEDS